MLLLALTWPHLRGRSRRELAVLTAFGIVLAGMNLAFYSALARAPLGVVASIELLGPLAVGIAAAAAGWTWRAACSRCPASCC